MIFYDLPADPWEYLPLTKRHCRRLGDHDRHYWQVPNNEGADTYWCSGTMIVEGGHG